MHEEDRHPVLPERLHEQRGVSDDFLCGMRLHGTARDALLQVDDHEGGCCSVYFEFSHCVTMGG